MRNVKVKSCAVQTESIAEKFVLTFYDSKGIWSEVIL